VARATVFTLLMQPFPSVAGPQAVPPAKAATGTAPAAQLVDGGWPRTYSTRSGGTIRIYQPQVASWDKQTQIVGYAAVSYSTASEQKPALGTVRIESNTQVAVAERLVSFSQFKVVDTTFPTLKKETLREVATEIQQAIPPEERVIALDRVLASIDKSQIIPKNIEGVKADPPAIFFSQTPAVLVNIDGDPIWSPIPQNDLRFAVNTNWDLFEHGPTKTYYLRHEKAWLTAARVEGPWVATSTLPPSFSKLPSDDNWKEVRAAVPARGGAAVTVFVSTKPAEMILLKGTPAYTPVTGTKLVWVSNTDSDLFRMGTTGNVYYLVAGRWFTSQTFSGPWTFATTTLPEDFRRISLEHPRSRVLASVPGTEQAAEAVLLAQVPQTARVNKKQVKAPDVTYQGEPQFQKIETTSLERAVNTDKDIIKVGDLYYMCFQGVWFMGRSPRGPWEATGSVPGTIYEIPISSPSHSVTYVTVEDDNDEWVVFAAAAAYTGLMVAWGCAVWGSGWYYPPYVGYGGFYPAYYPFYPTYGYSARYNPWTGSYARGAAVYGPYGGAGVGARYNPSTGTYARGAMAYGPYGARGAAEAYNPRTGAYGATRQGSGVYGSWGSSYVQRGDDWAQTSRVTNRATGTTGRVTRTDDAAAVSRRGPQGSGFVGATEGGDVYAGRDGNVYRREDGSWQRYNDGNWNSVQPTQQQRDQAQQRAQAAGDQARSRTAQSGADSSTMGQLNRDYAARSEGQQRTRDYSSSSGSSGSRSTGSYRPSGGSGGSRSGGARGGGGRRR
jgi:hypothetical protein